jgi:hypothetical protein
MFLSEVMILWEMISTLNEITQFYRSGGENHVMRGD